MKKMNYIKPSTMVVETTCASAVMVGSAGQPNSIFNGSANGNESLAPKSQDWADFESR